jgi:hypothetical protein
LPCTILSKLVHANQSRVIFVKRYLVTGPKAQRGVDV